MAAAVPDAAALLVLDFLLKTGAESTAEALDAELADSGGHGVRPLDALRKHLGLPSTEEEADMEPEPTGVGASVLAAMVASVLQGGRAAAAPRTMLAAAAPPLPPPAAPAAPEHQQQKQQQQQQQQPSSSEAAASASLTAATADAEEQPVAAAAASAGAPAQAAAASGDAAAELQEEEADGDDAYADEDSFDSDSSGAPSEQVSESLEESGAEEGEQAPADASAPAASDDTDDAASQPQQATEAAEEHAEQASEAHAPQPEAAMQAIKTMEATPHTVAVSGLAALAAAVGVQLPCPAHTCSAAHVEAAFEDAAMPHSYLLHLPAPIAAPQPGIYPASDPGASEAAIASIAPPLPFLDRGAIETAREQLAGLQLRQAQVSLAAAARLRLLLFGTSPAEGGGGPAPLPAVWLRHGLWFSSAPGAGYLLYDYSCCSSSGSESKAVTGGAAASGPAAVLSALQAHTVKHLYYGDPGQFDGDCAADAIAYAEEDAAKAAAKAGGSGSAAVVTSWTPSEGEMTYLDPGPGPFQLQRALVSALTDVLWNCRAAVTAAAAGSEEAETAAAVPVLLALPAAVDPQGHAGGSSCSEAACAYASSKGSSEGAAADQHRAVSVLPLPGVGAAPSLHAYFPDGLSERLVAVPCYSRTHLSCVLEAHMDLYACPAGPGAALLLYSAMLTLGFSVVQRNAAGAKGERDEGDAEEEGEEGEVAPLKLHFTGAAAPLFQADQDTALLAPGSPSLPVFLRLLTTGSPAVSDEGQGASTRSPHPAAAPPVGFLSLAEGSTAAAAAPLTPLWVVHVPAPAKALAAAAAGAGGAAAAAAGAGHASQVGVLVGAPKGVVLVPEATQAAVTLQEPGATGGSGGSSAAGNTAMSGRGAFGVLGAAAGAGGEAAALPFPAASCRGLALLPLLFTSTKDEREATAAAEASQSSASATGLGMSGRGWEYGSMSPARRGAGSSSFGFGVPGSPRRGTSAASDAASGSSPAAAAQRLPCTFFWLAPGATPDAASTSGAASAEDGEAATSAAGESALPALPHLCHLTADALRPQSSSSSGAFTGGHAAWLAVRGVLPASS